MSIQATHLLKDYGLYIPQSDVYFSNTPAEGLWTVDTAKRCLFQQYICWRTVDCRCHKTVSILVTYPLSAEGLWTVDTAKRRLFQQYIGWETINCRCLKTVSIPTVHLLKDYTPQTSRDEAYSSRYNLLKGRGLLMPKDVSMPHDEVYSKNMFDRWEAETVSHFDARAE